MLIGSMSYECKTCGKKVELQFTNAPEKTVEFLTKCFVSRICSNCYSDLHIADTAENLQALGI